MSESIQQQLLRTLPSISDLLATPRVAGWLERQPRPLVTDCLRQAVEQRREAILADTSGHCGPQHVTADALLDEAQTLLAGRVQPNIRSAVNATGIILHTALGRAIWPEAVTDSLGDDLKNYVTLAVDRQSGQRSERYHRIESLLCELTGAEAATVVNNNAGATLLALAALGGGREVVVSRGELIEIGGSFRLPDVMAASGCRMVEVGTTNRTHLRDYERAISLETAAFFRAHPSNYRVVGFTSRPSLEDMVELAGRAGVALVDDLGAGALVDLQRYNLPHEPTMGESIAAGADVVLASGDKLIGGPQAGIIVGRHEPIERIRTHPLARAVRADKTCLMILERTLMCFRDPDRLAEVHPLYRMLAEPVAATVARAETLREQIGNPPGCEVTVVDSSAYLGSGSLPMEQLSSSAVALQADRLKPEQLAERLRLDEAAVFGRIDTGRVLLDLRTVRDDQLPAIAAAVNRALGE